MCSNIGTPKNHHFPFGTNGKVVVLGVPILKHLRVADNQFIKENTDWLVIGANHRHYYTSLGTKALH